MTAPNQLPPNVYDGAANEKTADEINMTWSPVARQKLAADAANYGVDPVALKALSERLAYNCAYRLGKKDGIRFLGYTGTAASITADGPDYLLIKLVPSQWRARIYITGLGEGPTALDEVRMEGEGIMKPGDIAPDPVESIGNLPLP